MPDAGSSISDEHSKPGLNPLWALQRNVCKGESQEPLLQLSNADVPPADFFADGFGLVADAVDLKGNDAFLRQVVGQVGGGDAIDEGLDAAAAEIEMRFSPHLVDAAKWNGQRLRRRRELIMLQHGRGTLSEMPRTIGPKVV